MTRCAESAAAEPLAGSAPRARWWWLIEMPGAWGPKAVADCRLPAVASLASDDRRRVILVRRPGRHPVQDATAPLRVWIAGGLPGDPPTRLAIPEDHDQVGEWPPEGPAWAEPDPGAPVLAVCTNGSRDLCCGLDGRALVGALADVPGVWECSHLGGHRFAPTALHVPSGFVYGRLTEEVAHTLVDQGPDAGTAAWLRGRSAHVPAAQAAEIHLLRQGVASDPEHPDIVIDDDMTTVTFAGSTPVVLRQSRGIERPEQCGGEPALAQHWEVVSSSSVQA